MTALAPTRERLLGAARELVEEGGYSAASVVAVADRAGFAAGTLYRHFRSKEELFVELFREVCDRELEAVRATAGAPRRGRGRPEQVAQVLTTFAERALLRPRLAWALLAEPVDPLVDAERISYRARYRALLAGLLADAIAAGELPDQDPELTAAALVGALGEALVGPLATEPAAAARAVAALRSFSLRAIGAPPSPATATAARPS